jgi:hypothetical protein
MSRQASIAIPTTGFVDIVREGGQLKLGPTVQEL